MPRIVDKDELSFPVRHAESGQSLVLIALLIVLILAFAGLAIDAGFLFARSSQFSAAVDAATLAGAVDLPRSGEAAAVQSASEFLSANGWPVERAREILHDASNDLSGHHQFELSVTYPVPTYFLGLLGFNEIPVTHSATATIYSWADMPTATQAEQGMLRTAGQFLTGPASCTNAGDPVSAVWAERYSSIRVANRTRAETGAKYTYRIRVPVNYSGNELDVQLFDPDTRNTRLGPEDSNAVRSDTGAPVADPYCGFTPDGDGNRCMFATGESSSQNPVWLRRVDEYRKDLDPDPTDDTYFCPVTHADDAGFETITNFELYYTNATGSRVNQGLYQSGIDRTVDEQTDMRWVTPGVDGIPTTQGTFRIPQGTLATIPTDQDGFRNLYLDVSTSSGASKNGWDIWVGRPDASVPSDGNARNLYILDNLNTFSRDGIEVFAVGYLPTYTYYVSPPSLPIVSVDQSLGGHNLHLRVFGFDHEATFIFVFSTMSRGDWNRRVDLSCDGFLECPNRWSSPPMELELPSSITDNPDDADAFYGGYLLAEYAMQGDDHVWHATLPLGRPFLTR